MSNYYQAVAVDSSKFIGPKHKEIHPVIATCGHQHKTDDAAFACLSRLVRSCRRGMERRYIAGVLTPGDGPTTWKAGQIHDSKGRKAYTTWTVTPENVACLA